MATKKHLIIGAGVAALAALEQFRHINSEDDIKLVSMEDCLPYSPASLPYLISGSLKKSDLWLKYADYFRDLKASFVNNKKVTEILPDEKKVFYADGKSESYDTLLIASGSEPAKVPIKGLDTVTNFGIRTVAGCVQLRVEIGGKKNVAVMGAGLVGIKIAAALLDQGYAVSIIERAEQILPLNFNADAEQYIRETFEEHKAKFLLGKQVTEVSQKRKITVEFSDGTAVKADVLINATGVQSRIALVANTDIKTNKGILVDNAMRTNRPNIYAAGDVAEGICFFTGERQISAIIPTAVAQGKVAGANMAGKAAVYGGAITLTSLDFCGSTAFSVGQSTLSNGKTEVVERKNVARKQYRKLIFQDNQLIGAMFVNETIDPGIVFQLIKKRVDMTVHKQALFERVIPLSDPWLACLR